MTQNIYIISGYPSGIFLIELNLNMLVFEERDNLLEHGTNPTTNQTRSKIRHQDSNPGSTNS